MAFVFRRLENIHIVLWGIGSPACTTTGDKHVNIPLFCKCFGKTFCLTDDSMLALDLGTFLFPLFHFFSPLPIFHSQLQILGRFHIVSNIPVENEILTSMLLFACSLLMVRQSLPAFVDLCLSMSASLSPARYTGKS